MTTIAQLTQLQRTALLTALDAPSHCLLRVRGGYASHNPTLTTTPVFTHRLMRIMERAWLFQFDDPDLPRYAKLNSNGLALAQQLRAGETGKAVAT